MKMKLLFVGMHHAEAFMLVRELIS